MSVATIQDRHARAAAELDRKIAALTAKGLDAVKVARRLGLTAKFVAASLDRTGAVQPRIKPAVAIPFPAPAPPPERVVEAPTRDLAEDPVDRAEVEGWLALREAGWADSDVADEAGVDVFKVAQLCSVVKQAMADEEARDADGGAYWKPGRGPKLRPRFPAGPFTPRSGCYHHCPGCDGTGEVGLVRLPLGAVRLPLEEEHGGWPVGLDVDRLMGEYSRGVDLPPVVVSADLRVVDGRRRVAALRLLGRSNVECVVEGVARRDRRLENLLREVIPKFDPGAVGRAACPRCEGYGGVEKGSKDYCPGCDKCGLDGIHPALLRDPKDDPNPERKAPEKPEKTPTRAEARKLLAEAVKDQRRDERQDEWHGRRGSFSKHDARRREDNGVRG